MMIRMVKLLGIVLVAVLAIGAVAAQGAAAETEMTFTSEVEPTELTATAGPHEWRLGEVTVNCAKGTATGHLASTTPDQIDLNPKYEECKLSSKLGFFFAAWENPGCKTDFDSDTSLNVYTEKEDGPVSLNCGPFSHVTLSTVIEKELVLIEFFDTHPEGVPVNQELHGATYSIFPKEGLGPSEILIETHVFNLKFLCTGAKCPKIGLKEGTNETGTTKGSFVVKGFADEAHEKQVSLGITSP